MKKFLYTILFTLLVTLPSFAQNDPGFGDEGGGDAQTNPTGVPINQNLEIVLILGIVLGAYFVYNNRKSLSKN
jgi:hypothetical protein